MNRSHFLLLGLFLLGGGILAQSLWRNHNPYTAGLREGEILQLIVEESYVFRVDSKWNTDDKLELKLYPDSRNIDALKTSEASKKSTRKSAADFKIKDNYNFHMAVRIGKAAAGTPGNEVFPIEGKKTIVIDGKPVVMSVSGLIRARDVAAGKVVSGSVAELDLRISTRPPWPTRARVEMDPKDKTRISDAEKEKLILEHIREILGYFQN